jgi:hypothetical protein
VRVEGENRRGESEANTGAAPRNLALHGPLEFWPAQARTVTSTPRVQPVRLRYG